MRRDFPASVKIAAFKRANGRCEKCPAFLYVGKFRYDHIIPDELGGEPTLDNCQCLCVACDRIKTAQDRKDIAKAHRRERKHLGAKPRTHRPLPGGKRSRQSKKLSGEVVARQTQVEKHRAAMAARDLREWNRS